MPTNNSSNLPSLKGGSWYLLWVSVAAAFAVVEAIDYKSTRLLASAAFALAWACWAFSWYTKPFRVNSHGALGEAFRMLPIREGISQSLWNAVTISALLLSFVGIALKLANAA